MLTIISISITKGENADKNHPVIRLIKRIFSFLIYYLLGGKKPEEPKYRASGTITVLGMPDLKLYEIITTRGLEFKVNELPDHRMNTGITTIKVILNGSYTENMIGQINTIKSVHGKRSGIESYL